ncbi:tRNA pseudouridine(38-40) synthase TruA [Diaminobutyricimonas aerilata]|uniref:tRNA pseudouridine(38-40) synthase TruA n=1 Tax=Diaminobutyricimonas aerilata TaxID=1162967 RepID=UPI003CCB8243
MESGTVRLRLDIAYDGTGFSGWTRQPSLRTVQGELEAALATVFRRHGPALTLTVAGRTDAGVHATGQVAHLDLTPEQLASLDRPGRGKTRPDEARGPAALARRLNGIAGLSSDLYVSRVAPAPPGFDARFSAIWRRYVYRVADVAAERNPLLQNHTLWYPARLDVERMHAAAEALIGLHDWAAFCKPREGATTIRSLQRFAWRRDATGVLLAEVEADAFCHSMVRALVGASIAVGEDKLDAERLVAVRDGLARTSEFKVAPAKGLTLVEVGYPDDAALAERAEQTRALRTLPQLTDPLPMD